jgi:8-oxo-dGTP diphosphatase
VVEVAAAVIERPDGSFLLAQRPAGKPYAGWWEFPGGKVEHGEPAAEALERELHEELGIHVEKAYPWISRVHVYEHATVMLHFYRVVEWRGEPQGREAQAFVWQRWDAPMAEPMLPANGPVLSSLALPLEYAITDAQTHGLVRMLEKVERRLKDGLRLIQLRDREFWERGRLIEDLEDLTRRYGAKLMVASKAGRDGIHYTAAELMQLKSRPKNTLAGASCHTLQELGHAMAIGMDFAVLGPVKYTQTHPNADTLGWRGFAEIAAGASIPVYAIGGLTREDMDEARRAGAHGLAMIRGSWEP